MSGINAKEFREILESNPVIAAVFEAVDLPLAIESPCEIIFLLNGNICELGSIIAAARKKNKKLFVHIDLLGGIGKDQYSVQYIKKTFDPDGLITTKGNIAKHARDAGLFVIQRFFMLDSKAYESIQKTVRGVEVDADAIEILPGIIPSAIRNICDLSRIPVITGGMIRSKNEAMESLKAGALGISTSCKELW